MKLVRGISIGLAVIVAAVALFILAARFADGPVGPIPGGRLRSGSLEEGPVADWKFVESVEEVELQLFEPPRSRTTWILLHDAHAYIPCGFPNIRLWKQWPHQAVADGRAIVRINGKRYRVDLSRTEDPAFTRELTERLGRKYPSARDMGGPVWYFRLDPGASG